MTIRGKFNSAMLVMFIMMLGTTMVMQHLVSTVSHASLSQSQMRELSVFTDDARAEIFYRQATERGFGPMRESEGWWPDDILEDIKVKINLSSTEPERASWQHVHDAVTAIAANTLSPEEELAAVRGADRCLRSLRREYDNRIAGALLATAQTVSFAQFITISAALLSSAVFAMVVLMVRDWLVKPIGVLNEATRRIGEGELGHRVPLKGNDELGKLAQRFNTMAARLHEHQEQLLDTRELVAVGTLCTQVAHGLRNPLAGMRAGAQLVRRRQREDVQLQELMDGLIGEIDCIDARITRLFEFSRPGRLDRCETTARELIDGALSDARPALQGKHIEVKTDDTTEDRIWELDRERLSGAIGEIIANAAHHSDDGATIEVSTRTGANGNGFSRNLHIVVKDHGSGMHPNALNRAFDVFFTTRPSGTGMGLPLARRVINQLGGTLRIDSELGVGTVCRA